MRRTCIERSSSVKKLGPLVETVRESDWKSSNIFRATITCDGNLCKMIIDRGSSSTENFISIEVMELKLKVEQKAKPFLVAWVHDHARLIIKDKRLVSLIGKYKDQVFSNFILMMARNVLLEHDARNNTYPFQHHGVNWTLNLQKSYNHAHTNNFGFESKGYDAWPISNKRNLKPYLGWLEELYF